MKNFFYKTGMYVVNACGKLPFAALYLFADFLYVMMFYVVRYRRRVVRDNLRGSFPEKSEAEIRSIERKFYHHFSDLIIESIKNAVHSREIPGRVQYKNAGLLHQIYDIKKSVILYMGHYGNWEWLSVLPQTFKFRHIAFYKPLSNGVFDRLIKKSRESFGLTTIPSAQAYRALKTFNDNGEITCSLVLGDQSPPPEGTKVWLPFLNRETAFLVGAGKIASKLGHEVVFPNFKKLKRGHYEVEFIVITPDINDKINPYIRGYAEQLEKSIMHEPSLWLWSHRRWKLNREHDG